MYKLIRPILFSFDPEIIHHLVMRWMKVLIRIPFVKLILGKAYGVNKEFAPTELFGLKFKNRVGLAAGFDKDAKAIDFMQNLGFGFLEIGTVTPLPQEGNPKPRLFRLPADNALINRMGFNSDGLQTIVHRLRKTPPKNMILGGNIGKNKNTSNENAVDDYLKGFNALKGLVDYFVINISSPNTPGLRELQEKEPLKKLLNALQQENDLLETRIPILLKISPDLTLSQLDDVIEVVLLAKLDGIIASNTTLDRAGLKTKSSMVEEIGAGGLSGKPLLYRSTEVIRYIRTKTGKKFPIIASGGIMTANDAIEKINAGADLIQIYTGFVYSGPNLIKNINQRFENEKQTLFN